MQKNSGLGVVKKLEYEVTVLTGNIDGAGMYSPGTVSLVLIGTDDRHEIRLTNEDQFSVIKQANCFARGQETTFYVTCAIGTIKEGSIRFDNTGT